MTALYRLENVVRKYCDSATGTMREALRVPVLEIAAGEALAVVGPNAGGKSTLLELLGFLQHPDAGRIWLEGRDVWTAGEALAARRRCPLLLQRTVLFGTTVQENVLYGLRVRGVPRREALRRARAALQIVQLEPLAQRGHQELSGGERQRVALARILALQPEVLLLDEPTAHVDQANAALIEQAVVRLRAEQGTTIVLASHDQRQAEALANRVLTIVDGQCLDGSAPNLLAGVLEQDAASCRLRSRRGWQLRFARDMFRDKLPMSLPSGPVQLEIDARRWEWLTEDAAGCGWQGHVLDVQARGSQCRVQIQLSPGPLVTAVLSETEYRQLGLNVNHAVHLRPGPAAVRLLRPR